VHITCVIGNDTIIAYTEYWNSKKFVILEFGHTKRLHIHGVMQSIKKEMSDAINRNDPNTSKRE